MDGVDTIIRMAVDYGLSIGFTGKDLMLALLVVQFVGFPSALIFGQLSRRWGLPELHFHSHCRICGSHPLGNSS